MVSINRSTLRRAAAALGATALLSAALTPAATAQENPLDAARNIINQPGVPTEISDALNKGIGLINGLGNKGGDKKGGWEIPEDAPETNQFWVPTVSTKCINGATPSFGLATTVPGPAPLPLPGVGDGELGVIFTGLGTKGVAKQQNTEMKVYWVNVANGTYGADKLTYNNINPEGPGTINTNVKTGKGLVVAVLQGGFTADEASGPSDCNYSPTAGIFPVGVNK